MKLSFDDWYDAQNGKFKYGTGRDHAREVWNAALAQRPPTGACENCQTGRDCSRWDCASVAALAQQAQPGKCGVTYNDAPCPQDLPCPFHQQAQPLTQWRCRCGHLTNEHRDENESVVCNVCAEPHCGFWTAEAAQQAQPCKKCGQIANGQTGEYLCSECGLPTTHDAQPALPDANGVPTCRVCVWRVPGHDGLCTTCRDAQQPEHVDGKNCPRCKAVLDRYAQPEIPTRDAASEAVRAKMVEYDLDERYAESLSDAVLALFAPKETTEPSPFANHGVGCVGYFHGCTHPSHSA